MNIYGHMSRMERMIFAMKKVFICSPYRGDVEGNIKLAKKIGRHAAMCDYIPIIPHLVFPLFLSDDIPDERIRGITMGAELLESCDMMWIIGTKLTNGMQYELGVAKKSRIPIRCYDTDINRIYPQSMGIDDRVDEEFIELLKGAKFD